MRWGGGHLGWVAKAPGQTPAPGSLPGSLLLEGAGPALRSPTLAPCSTVPRGQRSDAQALWDLFRSAQPHDAGGHSPFYVQRSPRRLRGKSLTPGHKMCEEQNLGPSASQACILNHSCCWQRLGVKSTPLGARRPGFKSQPLLLPAELMAGRWTTSQGYAVPKVANEAEGSGPSAW